MRVVTFHRGVRSGGSDLGVGGVAALADSLTRYCERHQHTLVGQLGPGPGGEHPYLDDAQLTEQYRRLLAMVSPPEGKPALVVVPDAAHLGRSLNQVVERMIQLERGQSEVRCTDPDLPDLLQNARHTLSGGRGADGEGRSGLELLQERASSGVVMGRIPYGYGKGADGKFVPHPDEAAVVQRIVLMYTTAPPLGLRRIAHTLNGEGLRTRHGRPWSPPTLLNILRNPVYTGNYARYGMQITGNHPPLVSHEQFEMVRATMEARRPRRRPPSGDEGADGGSRFTLIGLVHCAECGSRMNGVSRRRAWRNESGEERERTYRYYECPLRNDPQRHPSWSLDQLHSRLAEWLRATDSGLLEGIDRRYAEQLNALRASRRRTAERQFKTVVRQVSDGHGAQYELHDALERLNGAGAGLEEIGANDHPLEGVEQILERISRPGVAAQLLARAVLSDVSVSRRKARFTAQRAG